MDTTTSGEGLEQRVAILRIALLASESGGKANEREGLRLRGVRAPLEALPTAGSAAASGDVVPGLVGGFDTPKARRLASLLPRARRRQVTT